MSPFSISDLNRHQDEQRRAAAHDRLVIRLRRSRRHNQDLAPVIDLRRTSPPPNAVSEARKAS